MTSTSMVGLPRESRISRARTLSMTALVVKLMGSFSSADAGDRATDKTPAVPSDRLSAVGYSRRRFHEDQSPARATAAALDPAPDLHLSGSLRGRAGAGQ